MKTLCTLCARGGSKGVKNKNIKKIDGKPLIQLTFEQAKEIPEIDQIVLSTDSESIKEQCSSFGLQSWFLRPSHLASDSAGKISVIRHALTESEKHFGYAFDRIMDLDITSPLRSIQDIKECLNLFESSNSEILITGCKARRNPYFNMVKVEKNIPSLVVNSEFPPKSRQEAPSLFDMNASIYLWRRDTLLKQDSLFTDKTIFYEMPEERSIDIDSPLDFRVVEMLINEKKDELSK
tara:strand:- start:1456 stop:2163 length:708 start_codon:yes stop_codon:yes gene_type:complete